MRRRIAHTFAAALLLAPALEAQASRPDTGAVRHAVISGSAVTGTYLASGAAVGFEVTLGRAVTLAGSGSGTLRTIDEVTSEARGALQAELRWWPARRAFEGWGIGLVAGRALWRRDCPGFDCADPGGEIEARATRIGIDVGHHWLVGRARRLAPHARVTVAHQAIDASSSYRPPRLDVQVAVGVGYAF